PARTRRAGCARGTAVHRSDGKAGLPRLRPGPTPAPRGLVGHHDEAAAMTLPVSTPCGLKVSGVAVSIGVVGNLVDPAAPDDADPCSGQDAHGVGMIMAAGAGF